MTLTPPSSIIPPSAVLDAPLAHGLAPSGSHSHHQSTVLVITDDRAARMLLTRTVMAMGHSASAAGSGGEAIAMLHEAARTLDAIVLDYDLADVSSLALVARIKGDPALASVPIIMLTGSEAQQAPQQALQQTQRAVEAGVFYSLPREGSAGLLGSVLASALNERAQRRALMAELSRRDNAGRHIRTCTLSLRNLTEAQDIACFLATCFPQPDRVVTGLIELLVNAIEHGNLDIGFEEKGRLLATGRWIAEIEHRLSQPEHAYKTVDVIYQHKADGWYVQISDKGAGFSWKKYWHIDPARAGDGHGRGIARARLTSFDKLAYNEAGNQVTAMVSANPATPAGW